MYTKSNACLYPLQARLFNNLLIFLLTAIILRLIMYYIIYDFLSTKVYAPNVSTSGTDYSDKLENRDRYFQLEEILEAI